LPDITDFYEQLSNDESDYDVLDTPVKNPGESYYNDLSIVSSKRNFSWLLIQISPTSSVLV
jgi:hypothetical protein